MKIVVFTQDPENCPHCKRYEPVVNKLIKEGCNIEVIQAFTEQGKQNALNAVHNIKSTPTTLFMDNDGNELHRFTGARPYSFVVDTVRQLN